MLAQAKKVTRFHVWYLTSHVLDEYHARPRVLGWIIAIYAEVILLAYPCENHCFFVCGLLLCLRVACISTTGRKFSKVLLEIMHIVDE
jgi:hypothetical protein